MTEGVLPVNKTDFVTMLHDIQYLQHANKDALIDDVKAIKNSDNSLAGIATKVGLLTRIYTGFAFNTTDYDTAEAKQVGDALMTRVKYDEPYRDLWEKYGVNKFEY